MLQFGTISTGTFSSQGLNGLSNPAASNAGHFYWSGGPEPPAGTSGPSPSGRLAHLRRSFHSKGLSEEVMELIRNLGGPQLNQPTLLSGIREIDGASDGVLIPFQHL